MYGVTTRRTPARMLVMPPFAVVVWPGTAVRVRILKVVKLSILADVPFNVVILGLEITFNSPCFAPAESLAASCPVAAIPRSVLSPFGAGAFRLTPLAVRLIVLADPR